MVCPVTTPLHSLDQGSPTTARGPNLTCEGISPGRKTHFANKEKIIYLRKICKFGRLQLFRKNHVTQDVRASNCCAIAYGFLSQKNFESPGQYELDTPAMSNPNGLLSRKLLYVTIPGPHIE